MMRHLRTITGCLLAAGLLISTADAAPRSGRFGDKKPKPAPAPPSAPAAPAEAVQTGTVPESGRGKGKSTADRASLTPALVLANMIYFEFAQGVIDYQVEVIETETDLRSDAKTTTRKQIYFLSPATTLTLQDGKALNMLSAELFGRFLDGVDLAFEKDEVVNGIPCYVVRVNPKEGAFKDNAKYYYLAQDDFRKIRIRAIKSDSIQQKKYWFINDFTYRTTDEGFLLLSSTQARLETWEQIAITATQATFQKYAINRGLDASFFTPYLKDMKFDDSYKD